MGRRIGLLGGTFDPPHLGHLRLAEAAREQLRLDQVLFLPVGQPPHKPDFPVTAVHHRVAMVQLAIADNPYFALDTTDIEREPPHHTHTLLPQLQGAYPQTQFWLLVGLDSLADLPAWEEPGELIQQCRLAAYTRPGVTVDWEALKTAVPGVETSVDLLEGPGLAISSSAIRQWSQAGHSLRYLMPTAVLDYIHDHRLYK